LRKQKKLFQNTNPTEELDFEVEKSKIHTERDTGRVVLTVKQKVSIGVLSLAALLVVGTISWAVLSGKIASFADVLSGSPSVTVAIETKDKESKAAVPYVNILFHSGPGDSFYSWGFTDANGRLEDSFQRQEAPNFRLKPEQPGFSSDPPEKEIIITENSPDRIEVTFFLVPVANQSTSIEGRVSAKLNNYPIEGAKIIASVPNDISGKEVGSGTSDAQGNYKIEIVPGIYKLTASKSGFENMIENVTVETNKASPANFVLSPLTSTPTPTPAKSVTPTPRPSPSPIADKTKFVYTVEIVDPEITDPATGTPALISNINVKIDYSPAINGQTSRIGLVSKDQPVDLSKYDRANLVADALPLDDCFSTSTTYTVSFSQPRYAPKQISFACAEIKLNTKLNAYFFTSGRLELSRTKTSISGVVQNTENGSTKPVNGATVMLDKGGQRIKSVLSSPDGKFAFTDLTEGTYIISCYHPDFAPAENQRLKIEKDQERNDIVINLIRGADNENRVLFEFYGKDVDGHEVILGWSDYDFESVKFYDPATSVDFTRIALPRNQSPENTREIAALFTNVPCQGDLMIEATIKPSGGTVTKQYFLEISNQFSPNCEHDQKKQDPKLVKVYARAGSFEPPYSQGNGWIQGKINLKGCANEIMIDSLIHDFTIELKAEQGKIVKKTTPSAALYTRRDIPGIQETSNYAIFDVEPGKYTVVLTSDGYEIARKEVEVTSPSINVNPNGNIVNLEVEASPNSTLSDPDNTPDLPIYLVGPEAIKMHSDRGIDTKRIRDVIIKLQSQLSSTADISSGVYIVDGVLLKNGIPNLGYSGYIQGSCLSSFEDEYPKIIIPTREMMGGTGGEDILIDKIIYQIGLELYDHALDQNERSQWSGFSQAILSDEGGCGQHILPGNFLGNTLKASLNGASERELFAYFLASYYHYHGPLFALINPQNPSLPISSQCQNTIGFAWQLFFEKIFNSQGTKSIFNPVGGALGDTIYSPGQIRDGLWRQEIYDKAPAAAQARVAFKREFAEISKQIQTRGAKARNAISVQVTLFNQLIDKLFPWGKKGSIEGTLIKRDKNGNSKPVENVIIIIGRKISVTDGKGYFKIEKIRTGEQKIKLINGETYDSLRAQVNKVNIQKDRLIQKTLAL